MAKQIKTLTDYEGLYEVSSDGQVRTVSRIASQKNGGLYPVKSKIKVARRTKSGYMQVALVRNNITHNTYLHRIIGEAFILKPEGCDVINHINGIKNDNRIENLEWVTSSQNNLHALENKLRKPKNAVSKEFKDSVLALRESGKTNKAIAEILDSTENIVQGITSKRAHRYV